LAPFGLETIGSLIPPFNQRRKSDRSPLTQVEFASKEGGEQAVEALNDKPIEGRRVWLVKQEFIHPSTADRIGRMDKRVLEQLQQAGLVQSASPSEA
jgi:hypothetical protein